MKNILFLFLILVSYSAKSQLNKGNVYLGGNIAASSRKNDVVNNQTTYSQTGYNKYNNYSLSPNIGFFLKDKLAVGGGLSYDFTKNENLYNSYLSGVKTQSNDNISQTSGFSFTPFVRQYFSLGTSVAIFINASASIGFGNNKNSSQYISFDNGSSSSSETTSKTKNINWGASITPGFIFFPSTKWSVDLSFASLEYNGSKAKETSAKSNFLGFSYGPSAFSLGVAYYLRSN